MPVSINTLISRANDPKNNQKSVKKNVLDKAFTGNGNNSRGYINAKNNEIKSFVDDASKMHLDAIHDFNSGFYTGKETKHISLHPYMTALDEFSDRPLRSLLKYPFELNTSDTLENNDLFDTEHSDDWPYVYYGVDNLKISMKIVATELTRERYIRKNKKHNVFVPNLMLITKLQTNLNDPYTYEYHDYDGLVREINRARNLDKNSVQITELYTPDYNDPLTIRYALKNAIDASKNEYYQEQNDRPFEAVNIFNEAADNLANNFVDMYSRGFAFWAQAYNESLKHNVADDKTLRSQIYNIYHNINMSFDELPKDIQDFRVLDDYQALYKAQKYANDNYVKLGDALFSQSLTLSLRLNDNLGKLKEASDNHELYDFNPQNKQVDQIVNQSSKFSVAQKKLLTSTDPLVVGVAGAGSGKSHTIVGRLAYLQQQGEDMSKVLVLSFTNTAADNITNRYPKVRSLTLSKLFHEMYRTNFANQQLSDDAVLSSSLQLINPGSNYFANRGYKEADVDRVIKKLSTLLHDMSSFHPRYSVNAYLNWLSQVINDDFKMVTDILDSIQQVSITLEPIIINAMLMNENIQNINIPSDIKDINFIITDESQDISTFEYVLLTELTVRYGANLMIVGDSTQTLYEFRDSNPDFLNTIEASNVFTLHRLNRNYRSNNDILEMGNQFLDVIRANRFAKMQLSSNNVTPSTVKSFTDHVQLDNVALENMGNNKDYAESLGKDIQANDRLLNWAADKLRKHEQVAILAFTKAEAKVIEDKLSAKLNSNLAAYGLTKEVNTGSLIKDQKRPSSLITDTVATMKLDDANHAPQVDGNLSFFKSALKDAVRLVFKDPSKAFVPRYALDAVDQFAASNLGSTLISNAMAIPSDSNISAVYNYVTKELLDAEIKHNQMNTYLSLTTDDDTTVQNILNNCDIVSSTIHSAKGLEFDNTIVVYRQSDNKKKSVKGYEEKLRLFGVALTRAKSEEYIINTLTPKDNMQSITHDQIGMYSTPMQTGYARVIDNLKSSTKAPSAATVLSD